MKCNNCKELWYCSEFCKFKDYEKHKGACIEASKRTNVSRTKHINENIACGAAYKISCTDPAFYRDPVVLSHREGKNVAERFLDSILHDAREIREMLRYKKPMDPLTPQQQAAYDSPHAVCHICKKVIFSILINTPPLKLFSTFSEEILKTLFISIFHVAYSRSGNKVS